METPMKKRLIFAASVTALMLSAPAHAQLLGGGGALGGSVGGMVGGVSGGLSGQGGFDGAVSAGGIGDVTGDATSRTSGALSRARESAAHGVDATRNVAT